MRSLARQLGWPRRAWTLLLATWISVLPGCGIASSNHDGSAIDGSTPSPSDGSADDASGVPDGAASGVGSPIADATPPADASARCADAVGGLTARRAADFLDAISLQAHASNGTPAYANAAQFVADVHFVGARHVRDGLTSDASALAVFRALAQSSITLVAGTPYGNLVVADLIAMAHTWQALAPGAVHAIESINEPELATITYEGQTGGQGNSWLPVARFTSAYYEAVKADPALSSLPFFGVSRVGAEADNAGLQYLQVPTPAPSGVLVAGGTVLGDYFTQHIYPMEIQYLHDGLASSAQTIDPTAGDQFDTDLHWNAVQTFHAGFGGYSSDAAAQAIPRVITEFGYSTATTSPGGSHVDESSQAKDLLTGLLNAWVKGYPLVSIYETYDGGDGYGIFAGPGSPKLAARYLHAFTTALADDSAGARTFAPGSLAVTFSGLPSTARALLLQAADCHFKLVMWENATNWDVAKGAPISVAPTPVTVSFGSPVSYDVYDATSGTAPVASNTGVTSATVSLADYPIVLDIHG